MRRPARAALAALGFVTLAACGAPLGPENTGSSRSATTTAFANDEAAYDYFVGKGLTSFQAAGIVGNLDQESGVDPTAVQAGGPGRGIAQWSVGGRWDTDSGDNLLAYATQEGQASDSLTLQLDFVWFELTSFSDYGLAPLQASTNVTDATVAFETDFEGCGDCDQSTRIAYAKSVLAAFGSEPDAGGGTAKGGDGGSEAGAKSADAGAVTEPKDAGGALEVADAGGALALGDPSPATAPDAASGCAASRRPARGGDAWWLAAMAFALLRGRRRRACPPNG